ncbi:MAG: iron-sulfur cluster assembly scaffold protein [Candidatus Omnitrophica bacterium]|nr:iron-sulfur cluster assembly scaffold protein [Candidatus Omnitrophota bacterium]
MQENINNLDVYPEHLITLAKNPKYMGRMNAPDASAFIKGPCGDEMEFYLVINNGVIEDIKFHTSGCIATIVCGSVTAELAIGKSIYDALAVSPKNVMDSLNGLPQDHCHCSILAVSTLYRALADYLLKK